MAKATAAEQALVLHRKLKGKIETKLKTPVATRAHLSVAYTPGVAAPCLEIAKDRELAYEYTWKGNTILIVTDGTAVLGLGDIGPEAALPVMEGKSMLFKEFGGVDCIPICLATKDPQEIINIVEKIAPAYGGINLEDISAPRCFTIEEELKKRLNIPVFHDDQHGTAIVVLAGIINAAKVVKKEVKKLSVVINGAGAAGIATAKLLMSYGLRDVTLCDTSGAIYAGRVDNMNPLKVEMAKITNKLGKHGLLADVLVGADVFIGVSKPGTLTAEMIRTMAKKPIVFAMANPTPEIMPDEAKAAGVAVMATGRSDFPNQVNNLLAFPGIFRGALDARAQITEEMKMAAALAIAGYVKKPTADCIIPSPLDKAVVKKVVAAVKAAAGK